MGQMAQMGQTAQMAQAEREREERRLMMMQLQAAEAADAKRKAEARKAEARRAEAEAKAARERQMQSAMRLVADRQEELADSERRLQALRAQAEAALSAADLAYVNLANRSHRVLAAAGRYLSQEMAKLTISPQVLEWRMRTVSRAVGTHRTLNAMHAAGHPPGALVGLIVRAEFDAVTGEGAGGLVVPSYQLYADVQVGAA